MYICQGELDLLNKLLIAGLMKNFVGQENIRIDEPMKNHTSFKVGGAADILVTPGSFESLVNILSLCKSEGIPFFVMGNGTNLIVRDKGIRGVVIKIGENFERVTVSGEVIEAEAGILLSKLANVALTHELAGLEFASGIPGTLGGAVAMNAGAYGGEMKDVVVSTQYLDREGNIKTVSGEEHRFGYRTSFIQKEEGIVLKSWLRLQKGNPADIKALMGELNKKRRDKQPLEMPSAGSVFKRPEGYFAGKLIEDCGLRGYAVGGAEVSCKHCGFIVNAGNATAEDIINLIAHIQSAVKSKFGVDLQTEVKIVGEE